MNGFRKIGYNNTYLFDTPENQIEFNNIINSIALFAKDYPNHNILIRTRLSGTNKADSIQNQKEKLSVIVKRLYEVIDGRPIVLVGHSQGGLVNMETALKCPNYIDKIISLNTPFDVNTIGKNFSILFSYCFNKLCYNIPFYSIGLSAFDVDNHSSNI